MNNEVKTYIPKRVAKCVNCGATLKSNICEYCKTEYDTEDNISYGVEAKRYYQSWINILTREYREE